LAKIQEIKSKSKPPLPGEIYTICPKLSLSGYRKKWLQNPLVLMQERGFSILAINHNGRIGEKSK
jgi:hypothetical protein